MTARELAEVALGRPECFWVPVRGTDKKVRIEEWLPAIYSSPSVAEAARRVGVHSKDLYNVLAAARQRTGLRLAYTSGSMREREDGGGPDDQDFLRGLLGDSTPAGEASLLAEIRAAHAEMTALLRSAEALPGGAGQAVWAAGPWLPGTVRTITKQLKEANARFASTFPEYREAWLTQGVAGGG